MFYCSSLTNGVKALNESMNFNFLIIRASWWWKYFPLGRSSKLAKKKKKPKSNFFLFLHMCCLHFVVRITLIFLFLNVVCNRLSPNEKGPFEKKHNIKFPLNSIWWCKGDCHVVWLNAIGSFFGGVVVNNIIVSWPSC